MRKQLSHSFGIMKDLDFWYEMHAEIYPKSIGKLDTKMHSKTGPKTSENGSTNSSKLITNRSEINAKMITGSKIAFWRASWRFEGHLNEALMAEYLSPANWDNYSAPQKAPRGPRKCPRRTQHAQNGPKMEPKWNQNGTRMEPKSGPKRDEIRSFQKRQFLIDFW